MYQHREQSNQIMMIQKRAHDSQIVRAKEIIKLSYGWPSQQTPYTIGATANNQSTIAEPLP